MINPDYAAKLETLKQRVDRTEGWVKLLSRAENRFPWIRLAVLVTGLTGVYIAFQMLPFLLACLSVLLFLLLFATAAYQHNRLIGKIDRLRAFQSLLTKENCQVEI